MPDNFEWKMILSYFQNFEHDVPSFKFLKGWDHLKLDTLQYLINGCSNSRGGGWEKSWKSDKLK